MFERCRYFDTLVAYLQQVYDVAISNHRPVLQIKGTVAELELSNMKTRLRAGIEAKAARGELKVLIPTGYVYDANDQLVMDPDTRVQQTIRSMFEKFGYSTTIRQLAPSYRDSHTLFPVKKPGKHAAVVWEVPKPAVPHKLISHPIFAGVYARDGTRNCGCTPTTWYQDSDGDGHGNPGQALHSCSAPVGYVVTSDDCDDASAPVWSTPGEAWNLILERLSPGAESTLLWSPPVAVGGAPAAVRYDTLRSAIASNFTDAATCLEVDGTDATSTDATDPTPGQTLFYLVRAKNACPGGTGTLGWSSSGMERSLPLIV